MFLHYFTTLLLEKQFATEIVFFVTTWVAGVKIGKSGYKKSRGDKMSSLLCAAVPYFIDWIAPFAHTG